MQGIKRSESPPTGRGYSLLRQMEDSIRRHASIVNRLVGKKLAEEIATGEAKYPLPQYSLPAAVKKDRPTLRILVPE